jgi:hypothetical protein
MEHRYIQTGSTTVLPNGAPILEKKNQQVDLQVCLVDSGIGQQAFGAMLRSIGIG